MKGQVASKESLIAEQIYKAKEREIISKVKSAYAMLFLAYKSIEIFQENTDLMRHFSKVAESKYVVGKASQGDVLRAQVELSKMLNMLVTLQQEKETYGAMLNTLLNRRPDNTLGIPQEPKIKKLDLSFKDLENIALTNRPELKGIYQQIERSNKILQSSELEYLPDIMAQFRNRSAKNPEMDNTQDIMVGFSIPLWFRKQTAMVEMARAEKEMNESEYQAMKNMTLYDVKNIFVKLQTAERLVNLYKTSLIPQAEETLKVSESAYQSDKLDFLSLVDSQRALLQFRLEYYQYLVEYEQRFAELERVIGKNLEGLMEVK